MKGQRRGQALKEIADSSIRLSTSDENKPFAENSELKLVTNHIRFLKVNPSESRGFYEYTLSFDIETDKQEKFSFIRNNIEIFGKTRSFDGRRLILPSLNGDASVSLKIKN